MSINEENGLNQENSRDKKNTGSSYSQSGNHGIGHMSGGVIKDHATVIGKVDTQNNVVNIFKKPINIAIASLTAIVGTIGIIFAGNQKVINIGGNVESGATIANELTIYKGDSPEVRQRKLNQAKNLIAQEVLSNISNMDTRLGYVATVLADDNFDQRLKDIRNQVAPSFNQAFDSDYRQLIRQQEISSLRGAYNSRPLSEVRELLIKVLVDSNTDARKAKLFSNNLTEVQDASESLIQELTTSTKEKSTDQDLISHHDKRVKLAVEKLINRSQIAHLSGLILLESLTISLSDEQERLSNLQYLEPNHLISKDEANPLLAQQLEEAQRLLKERTTIVAEAVTLRDKALDTYSKINQELTIQSSDPWNIVVAKATSLRQLGRTSEAVAAFSRYSDMFAEKDPTAKQYALTAQQFTIQFSNLGVEGGVYIYQVNQGGIADQANLKVGDIVIEYNHKKIINMEYLVNTLRDTPADKNVQLTYLRLSNTGVFKRHTVTVKAGSLGAGMMPI